MRNFRYSLAAVVLTLALAGSAFAGDMYSGYTSPPPPPQQTSTTSVAGDMYSGVTSSNATNGSETASVDTVREVALNLLQGLLALL
jgi:hypothetical protein